MKLHIHATGFDLDSELEKYVEGKLPSIYKTLPRKLRSEASCDIAFDQSVKGSDKMSTCSLSVRFENVQLEVTESTQHMYAALDIAVVYMHQQLENYLVENGYKQQKGEWRLP
jgi:ribosomal subunit interface protein